MTASAKKTAAKPASRAESFPLTDYLCFSVYSTNLAFGKAYKPVLEKLGLTYTQYITIVALGEEAGVTVGQLGEKLFLESNTLTPILKKLEAMGYVERQRDAQDERVVRLRLSRSGRKLRDQGVESNACVVEAAGLKPAEFAKLQKTMVTLRDTLLKSIQE